MRKIAITTLGCKANQLESSAILEDFVDNGWKSVDFKEKADIYILNTCTVTSKSDSESRYLIRKAKNTNSEATIIVTGCYAQISQDEIVNLEQPDYLIGNASKLKIFDILKSYDFKKPYQTIVINSDIMQETEFFNKQISTSSGKTRANLKIQDGCNNRCSYCIIPYARGKSRSNSLKNLLNQVEILTETGYKEIVLTGIHLGQWGLDFKPQKSLYDFLITLEKTESLERYRLSSLNPLEFSNELINLLINSKKFCRHLHISLQSMDNTILKAMNRFYSTEQACDLINLFVQKIPEISIGGDIIVGFPGETDELFENTYNNIKKLPISYMHIFPYSIREGTSAAVMKNQIPDNIKKYRTKILKELIFEKNQKFKKSFIEKTLNVLIELKRDKKTGLLKGISDNYLTVLTDNDDSYKNKITQIKILGINGQNLIGEICSK
ncbi:MAG: tRNA (N(6)-L-threonylcarbamoyladenosine(37)-C(2))-methylthiotransferase MtaB [Candidatus Gastranaerophilales bacterium]|nr:tRNA (N(6)-L-threonylcarbamoyladenosine(37)-C(2))-methylthiotransferase MtaB [Candidatus Gastranaerophilales bacterium]